MGEYLAEHLPRARYRVSEATYLAWVDLGEYFAPDEDLPMFFAYRAGVLLEGGNMFVQNSDCFIRLNLACPPRHPHRGPPPHLRGRQHQTHRALPR